MEEEIQEFLNKTDYDIRKSKSGRWIDQKCTMDVLSVVADCILEFLGYDVEKEFTTKQIWLSQYTIDNVQNIFNKPDPSQKGENEYDKWFGQPLKLLGYSRVLIEEKRGNKNFYKVNNLKILQYIAARDRFAHKFLVMYITKVLKDSEMYKFFEDFFIHQNKEYYQKLRISFFEFIFNNTPINGKKETGRIFTKVLNPLAFELKKKGTKGGRISNANITLDMIMYNRPNWRDLYNKKPKEITREEYAEMYANFERDHMSTYKINKAKKELKKYNERYRQALSECIEKSEVGEKATHIHHIFTAAEYPLISYYIENLIALTPTQHLNHAHINGNTNEINYEYQRLCLISKVGIIKENVETKEFPKIYSFEDLCYVLNVGFKTDIFDKITYLDFNRVLEYIDFMYDIENERESLVAESIQNQEYTVCNGD